MCPWLEMAPNEIPLLELPSTSADLMLPNSILMKTLEACLKKKLSYCHCENSFYYLFFRSTNFADRFIVHF